MPLLVASTALLIYDYLLTIYAEVRLVWFSHWTCMKVLFFLTRYIPMINIYILRNQLSTGNRPDICSEGVSVGAWFLLAGVIFAEAILMIRTWAVWRRDWRIGIFLVTILIGCFVSLSINCNQFSKSLAPASPPYDGFRGCLYLDRPKSLIQALITLAVMDAVVLGLMMISAIEACKSCNNNEFLNVVHRDAILFYLYMLICSTASAIVAHFWPVTLMDLLVPLQGAVHSILVCRIVLNIRSVAVRAQTGAIIGLHSDYEEMGYVDSDSDSDVELTTRIDLSLATTSYHIF